MGQMKSLYQRASRRQNQVFTQTCPTGVMLKSHRHNSLRFVQMAHISDDRFHQRHLTKIKPFDVAYVFRIVFCSSMSRLQICIGSSTICWSMKYPYNFFGLVILCKVISGLNTTGSPLPSCNDPQLDTHRLIFRHYILLFSSLHFNKSQERT